jgi:hypothetical protein
MSQFLGYEKPKNKIGAFYKSIKTEALFRKIKRRFEL